MPTVPSNSIPFRHTNGCSCKSVKVFETENVSTWGGHEPPTSGVMPNTLTIWATMARHLLSHDCEYWWVNICNVHCVLATAFISTHERMFLWKCQSVWDRMSYANILTAIDNKLNDAQPLVNMFTTKTIGKVIKKIVAWTIHTIHMFTATEL